MVVYGSQAGNFAAAMESTSGTARRAPGLHGRARPAAPARRGKSQRLHLRHPVRPGRSARPSGPYRIAGGVGTRVEQETAPMDGPVLSHHLRSPGIRRARSHRIGARAGARPRRPSRRSKWARQSRRSCSIAPVRRVWSCCGSPFAAVIMLAFARPRLKGRSRRSLGHCRAVRGVAGGHELVVLRSAVADAARACGHGGIHRAARRCDGRVSTRAGRTCGWCWPRPGCCCSPAVAFPGSPPTESCCAALAGAFGRCYILLESAGGPGISLGWGAFRSRWRRRAADAAGRVDRCGGRILSGTVCARRRGDRAAEFGGAVLLGA